MTTFKSDVHDTQSRKKLLNDKNTKNLHELVANTEISPPHD